MPVFFSVDFIFDVASVPVYVSTSTIVLCVVVFGCA